MPLHLLHLDLDRVKGVTEHLALFYDGGNLHGEFPECEVRREADIGGRVVDCVDGRNAPTQQLR